MIMKKPVTILFSLALCGSAMAVGPSKRPHIVVMLADDMGYGELQCLNPNEE